MADTLPPTPQDRAAIAAAVLRHYRDGGEAAWTQGRYHAAEACDLAGAVRLATADRVPGSAEAQDAMLIACVRHGLDLDLDTPAKAETALVGFNDYPDRTFADVLALCEKVARRLEAEAQA